MADTRNTYRGRDRQELRSMLGRITRFLAWQAGKEVKPGRGGQVFITAGSSLTALNGSISSGVIAALNSKGPTFTPVA